MWPFGKNKKISDVSINEKTSTPEDPFLAKIRALQAEAGATSEKARQTLKRAKVVSKNTADVLEGAAQVGRGAGWIGRNILQPVWSVLNPFIGWAVRGYANLWNKVVHVTDEDGDVVFSKKRAGIMVLSTALAASGAYFAAPEVAKGTLHAAWYAASHKTERMVLNGHSDPINGIYSVAGCHSAITDISKMTKYPCDTSNENTVTWLVDDSLFHDAHSFVKRGDLFLPDQVAKTVPKVPAVCDVDYYGWRAKIISRWGHMYPRLIEVRNCELINISPKKDFPAVAAPTTPAQSPAAQPPAAATAPATASPVSPAANEQKPIVVAQPAPVQPLPKPQQP